MYYQEAQLSSEMKEALGVPEAYTVVATTTGLVKINDQPFTRGELFRDQEWCYNRLRFDGNTHRTHRLVYAAFHPEALESFQQGTRVLFKRPLRVLEDGVTPRGHLEDLILEPLSVRPASPVVSQPTLEHPFYGTVRLCTPYVLQYRDKHRELVRFPTYRIEFYNSKECPCRILNTRRGEILRLTRGKITLFNEAKQRVDVQLPNAILTSAFPEVTPDETIDHLDDDHTNNVVTNLHWKTVSENSRKGQMKSASRPQRGHPVAMLDDERREVARFDSISSAARLILKYERKLDGTTAAPSIPEIVLRLHGGEAYGFAWEEEGGQVLMQDTDSGEAVTVASFPGWQEAAAHVVAQALYVEPTKDQLKTAENQIRKRANPADGRRAHGYHWSFVEEADEEGEKWVPVPSFICPVPGYTVSNKGRVKNLHGYLMYPSPNRRGKYSSVSLLQRKGSLVTKRIYVHHLVWSAFNGRWPDGQILHDDTAPLRNGLYRNHLEDLREGRRRENMLEHSEAKRVRLVEGGERTVEEEQVVKVARLLSAQWNSRRKALGEGARKDDKLQKLIEKRLVKGIELKGDEAHGKRFQISKRFMPDGKALTSTSKGAASARVRFMHVLEAYLRLGVGRVADPDDPSREVDYEELVQLLSGEEQTVLRGLSALERKTAGEK